MSMLRQLAVLLLLFVFAPLAASANEVVIIPGDTAMQQMLTAVRQVKNDPAFDGISFRLLPQSLMTPEDARVLDTADVVVARHMVGSAGAQMVPAMQALKKRGGIALGAGQNDGAPAALGLVEDLALRAYFDAGGADNLVNMLRLVVKRQFGRDTQPDPPKPLPQQALWDPHSGVLYEDFLAYAKSYLRGGHGAAGRPWVALMINRGQALETGNAALAAMVTALEARNFNVVGMFGSPAPQAIETLLIDDVGKARVVAVVAMSLKQGNIPDKIGPVLQKLDVPLVNAITLYKASRAEWEASPIGIDLAERSWQVAGPELAGIIAPTVVATKERRRDPETGLDFIAEVPVPDRVERLADRIQKLVALRTLPAAEKRVAIVYYNSPPGVQNVGASYLNVMPKSLWQILQRLEADGYVTTGRPADEAALSERLRTHGANIGSWSPGALSALVASGEAILLPMAEYRRWFDNLPATLRDSIVKAWGEPEDFKVMTWRNGKGETFFVFPGQRYGNLLFAPQPVRGWGEVTKQYHDVALPPHHQYLAFYLWLQRGFDAHAMVHVGTHGTHEWLPGKEVGFTEADPSEVMVGAVPQVYPYIVDVVGEGLQAKRRGMATLISHMTPPFDQAGMSPDMIELMGLLDDHAVAMQKSEAAAAAKLSEINARATRMGILKDIGKTRLANAAEAEELHTYLHDLERTGTPFGMHVFGLSPPVERRWQTAEAMVQRMTGVAPDAVNAKLNEVIELLGQSGPAELDAFSAAMAGRYVAASSGGDPLRNPASLPTGRNLYGFDPARMPSRGIYEQGAALAKRTAEEYRTRHGIWPDRLMFTLWSGETMRHEGIMESQILALLGVRPTWDSFGRVTGVEVIDRAELGRPRVDVVMTPSGLYRDSLPMLMTLLDSAVSAVKGLAEADNMVRVNVERTRASLIAQGLAPEQAERMAAVRLFSPPPGAYGNGLSDVVLAGNRWSSESEVADVYFRFNSHLFGQGFWGDQPQDAATAKAVFKMALKDVRAVLHPRSSNLYGTLDNDDVYQYLGGAAMAVRAVNGKTPETLLVDMSNPTSIRTETLDQSMGREMRTRYLNPKWINAMLDGGYAGARMIMQVHDNLWGWQVTVPDAVDPAKWQAMYETYVDDRYKLNIRERFRAANNMAAYQAMVDRMLVAVRKGYWKADALTIAKLEAANRAAIREAGVACSPDTCSSPEVIREAARRDRLAAAAAGFGLAAPAAVVKPQRSSAETSPTVAPARSPAAQPSVPAPAQTLRGQQMRESVAKARTEPPLRPEHGLFILLLIGAGMVWQAVIGRRERFHLQPV